MGRSQRAGDAALSVQYARRFKTTGKFGEWMMTAQSVKSARLPPVKLSAVDHERLAGLANAAMERFPEAASILLEEVERAELLPPDQTSAGIVGMYSYVTFVDQDNGSEREIQLVYPNEADISRNRVSVLSLVGAALIGLSEGQSIACPTRGGTTRLLKVMSVRK